MDTRDLKKLLDKLCSLPKENEWVEFKENKYKPDETGEYISALSNSACLHEKENGYLIFGVEDQTHRVKGTSFNPRKEKVGNEELENWLTRNLSPTIDFQIIEFDYKKKPVVIFKINPTYNIPVSFKGVEYIRVGSYKKKLKDHPEKARKIWIKTRMIEINNWLDEEQTYYIEIKKRLLKAYTKYGHTINTYKLKMPRSFSYNFGTDSIEKTYRISKLLSWWEQVFKFYSALHQSLIEFISHLEISETFDEISKKLGMIVRAEYYFEDFLSRLFPLMNKIAQLSNIYHKLEIKPESVSYEKIIETWGFLKEDKFIQVVNRYLQTESIRELKQIYVEYTRINTPVIIGIGYPSINRRKKEGKTHYSCGGYPMALDPVEVKTKLLNVFNELTNLITELDDILKVEWDNTTDVQ